MEGMKSVRFIGFEVWEVVVPARADILEGTAPRGATFSLNLTWPELSIHVVRGELSNGLIAVGESNRGESADAVGVALHHLLSQDLATSHPMTASIINSQPNGLPLRYPAGSPPSGASLPLLESLWLDAAGKLAGVPAHALLGGAVRDRVPVDFWANRPGPETLRKLVHEAVARGFRGMKLKSDGHGDVVDAITAISRDIPADFSFTIDPMNAWRTLREGGHLLRRLAELPQRILVEDPFDYEAVEDWHQARARYPLAFACHARDEAVLDHALRNNLAEIFNIGGTAFTTRNIAYHLQRHTKDCWLGSALELGILQHLRLHTAACIPNAVLPSDLQGAIVREHSLVTEPMTYENGHAILPNRPGLGVELDHAAVERYAINEWQLSGK